MMTTYEAYANLKEQLDLYGYVDDTSDSTEAVRALLTGYEVEKAKEVMRIPVPRLSSVLSRCSVCGGLLHNQHIFCWQCGGKIYTIMQSGPEPVGGLKPISGMIGGNLVQKLIDAEQIRKPGGEG